MAGMRSGTASNQDLPLSVNGNMRNPESFVLLVMRRHGELSEHPGNLEGGGQ